MRYFGKWNTFWHGCSIFKSARHHFFLDTLQVPAGYRTFTHNNALGVGEFWKQAPLDTVLGGNLTHNKMLHEFVQENNMA